MQYITDSKPQSLQTQAERSQKFLANFSAHRTRIDIKGDEKTELSSETNLMKIKAGD